MSDFRRRLMCKKNESELPLGYTKLNCLESTGTQLINTNIIPSSDYSVEISGQFKSGNIQMGTIDAQWDASNINKFSLMLATRLGYSRWGSAREVSSTKSELGVTGDFGDDYTLKIDKNGIYVNGVKKIIFEAPKSIVYSSDVFLFFGTYAQFGWASAKHYYEKIWDNNGILIYYGVPALDPNGKPCMYDMIIKNPFYNQGTGEFLYG